MSGRLEPEKEWQEIGAGVSVLVHDKKQREVSIGTEGMDTLSCICVPIMFFDPFEVSVKWMNATFEEAYGAGPQLAAWIEELRGCVEPTSDTLDSTDPSRVVLEAIRSARSTGHSIDIYIPKSAPFPFLKTDLSQAWTLHCHAISMQVDGKALNLMTLQAPSLVTPPLAVFDGTETATDRVVALIDRAMDNCPAEVPVLSDLRQRVLDGRMNEPIDSGAAGREDGFHWDTSASLAMMLGIPFAAPDRTRKSIDYYKPLHGYSARHRP